MLALRARTAVCGKHNLLCEQTRSLTWHRNRHWGSRVCPAYNLWPRLSSLCTSSGHSSGGLLWCARHTHRNAPPACPGAWPRSSYLTSQIKLKNHLNMRLILRVGYHVLWSFSMNSASWHYPSTPTRPAWPKDSKTVLGYDFGYVTDLVDTKNGKNRFLSLEDSNLNFGIWIFLSRAQFYVLYPSNRVSRSCAHKNMPNYWGGSEHFCVTTRFRLLYNTQIKQIHPNKSNCYYSYSHSSKSALI